MKKYLDYKDMIRLPNKIIVAYEYSNYPDPSKKILFGILEKKNDLIYFFTENYEYYRRIPIFANENESYRLASEDEIMLYTLEK
jgi:hypothetical protein